MRSSRWLAPTWAIAVSLAGGCTRGESTAPPSTSTSPSASASASAATPVSPSTPAASATSTSAAKTSTAGPAIITAAALSLKMDAARERLDGWIQAGVSDPSLPWAMGHGLLAFGPELRAQDGQLAIDAIVGAASVVKGRVRFPEKTEAGGVVDAHANLMVKKMIEAGVPWERAFAVRGKGKVTLERLALDAIADLRAPADDHAWSDAPWTITIALREAKHRKKLDEPTQRRLKGLALQTLAQLEDEQDFLMALLERQRPDLVEKKKQHIYAHACGGLHFVQAALYAAAFVDTAEAYERARKQLEVVMFRWIAERDIYRRAGLAQPQYRLLVLVQELKFYGHVLEVFALAHELGIISREPAVLVQLGGVAQDLMRTLDLLSTAYGQLDRLRATSEQTYLDMIGDGAHAVHGLRAASVAFFRPQ
jgi:hypothetical protein